MDTISGSTQALHSTGRVSAIWREGGSIQMPFLLVLEALSPVFRGNGQTGLGEWVHVLYWPGSIFASETRLGYVENFFFECSH